jgi:hypothetical protein
MTLDEKKCAMKFEHGLAVSNDKPPEFSGTVQLSCWFNANKRDRYTAPRNRVHGRIDFKHCRR